MEDLKGSKEFLKRIKEIDEMDLTAMERFTLQMEAIAKQLKQNNMNFEKMFIEAAKMYANSKQNP